MLVESLGEKWTNIVNSTEEHLRGYPLVDNPAEILGLVSIYYIFVFRLGPYLMSDRPPLDLRVTIMAYNVVQMVLNFVLAVVGIPELIRIRISPTCTEYDPSPNGKLVAKLVYCYFLLKILDMADTVFFVLRKKHTQVTFLHLYHHISMVLGTWTFCKIYPGGHVIWIGPINTIIHVIMYFYYFLTAWDPEHKKYTWLKKHITQLQLVQHVTGFILMSTAFFHPTCNFPRIYSATGMFQGVMMIALFGDFYMKTYHKNPEKAD